jgi:thiol-disulfide isomerase/thioredoxin
MSNNPSRKISRHQQAARSKQPPNRTGLFVALGVAAVIAIAVVVGVVASGGDDDSADDDGSIAVSPFAEIIGEPLPPFPSAGAADPALGSPAPNLRASTFAGEQTTVETDSGPMVIAFFAHWCPVCQQELPVVVDWLAAGRLPDGVELVAVSTAVDPPRGNDPPQDWFAREGYPLPVLADDENGSLATGYGLMSFPYFVVVDADGTVVLRAAGAKTPAELDAIAAAALS